MSGTFRWVDGPDNNVSLADGYTNLVLSNFSGENCLVFLGIWDDVECTRTFGYIVEYECPSGMEFGDTACQGQAIVLL